RRVRRPAGEHHRPPLRVSGRALVTGATGLVGSHLVEALRASGREVVALVRNADAAAWLRAPGVRVVAASLDDAHAMRRAADGCDAILHTAAVITPPDGRYTATNVDGTRAIVELARETRARLVQLSSVAVYGPEGRYALSQPDDRWQETRPFAPLPPNAAYAISKRASETIVLDAHRAGECWATAIRPCVIFGRRDRQFTPRVHALLRLGAFPFIGGGSTRLPLVHASTVASLALRALADDRAGGEAYNAIDRDAPTMRDVVHAARAGLGRSLFTVPIPVSIVRGALATVQALSFLLPRDARGAVRVASLDLVLKDSPFSGARARTELGWEHAVDARAALTDAFAWRAAARR
ncbi:MAG: NAD-dependent epimerase/dehydratase family protein, partial [Gemmatimonadaceae bacterium]|nr:NAD-dependent epimerase/dehydratase family protein [Gemmatimonadaceae bacterium]